MAPGRGGPPRPCRPLVALLAALALPRAASEASGGGSRRVSVSFSAQGGGEVPALAFGTSDVQGPAATEAVATALRQGFRHLDAAELYRNLRAVGAGLNRSGVARAEVFLTVKVSFWGKGAETASLRRALEELGVGSADLCLLHSPFVGSRLELAGAYLPHRLGRFKPAAWRPLRSLARPLRWILGLLARLGGPSGEAAARARLEAWQRLEEARAAGLCRFTGVSNYDSALLEELSASARQLPAVNQIEFHPRFQARAAVEACRRLGVAVMGYGIGVSTRSPAVQTVAAGLGASPTQVALRWALQSGAAGIVRSSREAGMAENLAAAGMPALSEQDMAALAEADEGLPFYWDPSALAGLHTRVDRQHPEL